MAHARLAGYSSVWFWERRGSGPGTLLANRPALAIARRLGFEPYASHLAVRLRAKPEAG